MSSNLNDAQAETFNVFAEAVAEFLTENSTESKRPTLRLMEPETFLKLWKTVSRPSGLGKTMQTQKFFGEHGRTKKCFQLRDKVTEELLWKDEKKTIPVLSDSCTVMYTVDAYRVMRQEKTGLKTPEIGYAIPWTDVPGAMQHKIASFYFPRTQDKDKNPLPRFVPVALVMVLRKGNKVKKGEKRHAWSGFDFAVTGFYGDSKIPSIINQIAVPNKPYLAKFAEFIGAECPDWGQNDVQPEQEIPEELAKAACGIMDSVVNIVF